MKYLLYGYGLTNKAVSKHLENKKMNFDILVPENEIPEHSKYNFINREKFTKELIDEYDVLIRSPGIPFNDKILMMFSDCNKKILSEIELAYSFNNKGIIIAITGSNGKTSTLSFLEQLLTGKYKVVVAGNNDVPYISVIDTIDDSTIVLLELSSFQLENIESFKPTIACITNLTPNHLDKTLSIERYYKSKLNILKNNPIFLKNADDSNISYYIKDNFYTYSLNKDANYLIKNCIFYENNIARFDINSFKLKGKHNEYNLLVALSICKILNVDDKFLESKLKDIRAPRFRNEYVTTINGIDIYNDSKSTVPESTIAAVNAFNKKVHVLVGGYDKNISFYALNELKNAVFYAFGHSKYKIKSQVEMCESFDTMEEAFLSAILNAKSNEVILFSPACASFDQFKSYKERGVEFEKLVLKYKDGRKDDH